MKLHYFIAFLSNLFCINTDASNFPVPRSSTDLTVYQEMSDNIRVSAPVQRLQSNFKTRTSSDIDSDNSTALPQPAHVSLTNNQLISSSAQIVVVPVPVHQTVTKEKLSVKTQFGCALLLASSLIKLGFDISYVYDYYSRPHLAKESSNFLAIGLGHSIINTGVLYALYKMNEDLF